MCQRDFWDVQGKDWGNQVRNDTENFSFGKELTINGEVRQEITVRS